LAVNPSAAQIVKTDDDFWFDTNNMDLSIDLLAICENSH